MRMVQGLFFATVALACAVSALHSHDTADMVTMAMVSVILLGVAVMATHKRVK